MVRFALAVSALLAALVCPDLNAAGLTETAGAGVTATAAGLTDTADSLGAWPKGLEPADKPPAPPANAPNELGEDFFVITMIAAPFTGLFSAVAVTAVMWAQQGEFPPKYGTGGAAAIGLGAAAGALTIATLSVDWGQQPAPARH